MITGSLHEKGGLKLSHDQALGENLGEITQFYIEALFQITIIFISCVLSALFIV